MDAIATRKTRIAVVNTHPIQYFAPLYAHLNASPDLEVTVLYLSDFSLRGAKDPGFGQIVKWDIDLLSGYPYLFVGPKAGKLEPNGFASIIVPRIWQAVRGGGYDALWLNGHGIAANLIALAAAKSIGIPVLMRCDTHLGLPCSGVKAVLRKPLLSILYSQCDGFLAIGTANKRFYLAMGVPEQKISLVPFTVDNARFMEKPRLSRNDRLAARERYGIATNRPAILYVSKFIRRKHPDHLVLAAQRLAAEGLSFDLVLAGSGEMRTELEALIARGGPPHIVMPGFINQQDMPKLLGACDLFVLPSENEPWGLIVNEAMCAGLPIVVSAAAGCATDLVRQGENGFVFAAGSVDALADALRPIITDAGLRQSMSRKSIEIIEGWNYGRCLDGLRDAVARCCRDPKRYVPNWPEARAMKRTCK